MSGGRPIVEKESTTSGILPNYPHHDAHHLHHHHHLVLIHGIGHGAWCWYKIRCLMEASGYKVTCLDLKGAGVDQTDPNTVLTFQDYNQPLTDFLSSLPGNEKVILVGHSAGGMSLTDAIHRFASKIHMAIYVAATMLEHGFSTHQDIIDGEPDLSAFGNVNKFIYGLGVDQPPTSVIIKENFHHQILYQMSPIEDVTLASMLLRPGPVMALKGARFQGYEDAADCLPRVYIKTLDDHVLKLEQQDAMIKRWPPSQVFVLQSDHSPFFSTPIFLFAEAQPVLRSLKVARANRFNRIIIESNSFVRLPPHSPPLNGAGVPVLNQAAHMADTLTDSRVCNLSWAATPPPSLVLVLSRDGFLCTP